MTAADDPSKCTMGLMEHLRELRKRLVYAIISIVLGAIVAYWYSTELFAILCEPYFKAFSNSPLIGTSPAEAWLLKVKVAIFGGILITSPVLFYQLWLFVAPGLYSSERKLVLPFVAASTLLFIVGATLCYYQILPLTLRFFYDEFVSIGITPTIKISDHLSMTISTVLGFGLVFEMPLLALFLARAGLIDHRSLLRWFRHAVVAIFILAAAITPPDVLTQLLMAGPLLLLYGISIVIAYVCSRPARSNSVLPVAQGESIYYSGSQNL